MGACRKVAQATEAVVTSVSRSTDDKSLKNDLQNAARDVSDSLNRLMDQIRYTNFREICAHFGFISI